VGQLCNWLFALGSSTTSIDLRRFDALAAFHRWVQQQETPADS
jgi:hypothetical protein